MSLSLMHYVARGGRRSLPLTVTSNQTMTGRVCEQDSTAFNITEEPALGKMYQDYAYGSAEWSRRYQGPRATVESANASMKDDGKGRLAQSGLRRVRGYGKQLVMIALDVCFVNLVKINKFLRGEDAPTDTSSPTPGTRRRRLSSALTDFVAPELPRLVPGHGSPPMAA